jgi:hypothetical protein
MGGLVDLPGLSFKGNVRYKQSPNFRRLAKIGDFPSKSGHFWPKMVTFLANFE